jgi:hypothetical protein
VLYGGYGNSYSFKFNDKKFITNPLQIFEFEAQKKVEVIPVLTIQQFTQALKEDKLMLLVMNQ